MKRPTLNTTPIALLALGLIGMLPAVTAHAQVGQGRSMGMTRGATTPEQLPDLTLTDLPLDLLAKKLNLSADQKERIADVLTGIQNQRQSLMENQQSIAAQMQSLRSNTASSGGVTTSNPLLQRQQMQLQMQQQMQQIAPQMQQARNDQQRLQTSQQTGIRSIERLLTIDQRQIERTLVKDANLFRNAALPFETLGDITLTDAQRDSLRSLSEQSRREQARQLQTLRNSGTGPGTPGGRAEMQRQMQQSRETLHRGALAALTPDQQAIITAYEKAHPQTNVPNVPEGA